MTTAPGPGWYPDPQAPDRMRWWDGGRWTDDTFERVEPVGGYLAPAGAAQTGQRPAQPGQHPAGHLPHAQQTHGQPHQWQAGPTTPDGVRLASWGRRAGARVIDNVIAGAIGLLLSLPLLTDFIRHVRDVTEQQSASGSFDPFAIYDGATIRDLLTISLVQLAVGAVYEISFLLWRQATPGKLMLGLRVRLRAEPSLPARAVLLRWASSVLPGQVPTVGPIYTLVDSLWPLRDDKRQAVHDKAASTCVVHPVRVPPQPRQA